MTVIYLAVVIAMLVALLAGDYWRARPIRELNRRVAAGPQSLTPEQRQSAAHLLSTVGYAGPFTFIEARKLRLRIS